MLIKKLFFNICIRDIDLNKYYTKPGMFYNSSKFSGNNVNILRPVRSGVLYKLCFTSDTYIVLYRISIFKLRVLHE